MFCLCGVLNVTPNELFGIGRMYSHFQRTFTPVYPRKVAIFNNFAKIRNKAFSLATRNPRFSSEIALCATFAGTNRPKWKFSVNTASKSRVRAPMWLRSCGARRAAPRRRAKVPSPTVSRRATIPTPCAGPTPPDCSAVPEKPLPRPRSVRERILSRIFTGISHNVLPSPVRGRGLFARKFLARGRRFCYDRRRKHTFPRKTGRLTYEHLQVGVAYTYLYRIMQRLS